MRDAPALTGLLWTLGNEPLLAFIIGAPLTWLAHSTLAVVLLVTSLTASGVVFLPLAAALILGANLGGAIAPFLITSSYLAYARAITPGNLLMRAGGTLALVPFLGWVLPFLEFATSDPARQALHFHTVINLATAVFFLPLLGFVAYATERLL